MRNELTSIGKINFMETKSVPIFLRYGGAKKPTFEMSHNELEQAAESILRRAKEKAFSKGRPIIFGEGDKVLAEYPDGHIEEVKAP
jgi:hypothetical protein